ncbi:MAG: hypothetical protein KDA78_17885, partial [Planctomycetaceae bacterium]|nr:hypothetical protein [Planctomycetaceae bacterium]
YPLVGGITLTGLMILGDHRVARFYEIIAPSALLSLIGIICIHLERFFPNDESSFNRRNFGRDFYLAGHAVLIGGLGLLLGGRIVGHFFDSYFVNFGWFTKPDVVTSIKTQSLALAITLSATGTYFLAAMRNAKSRQLLSAAVFTLCWSGVILFDLSGIVVTKELLLCLISTGGLIMQVTGMWLNEEDVNRQHQHFFSAIQTVYLGTLIHFGTAAVGIYWILNGVMGTTAFDVHVLSTLSLMITTAGLAIGTLCYSRLCSTFCTRSTYWLTCVAALATLSAVCLHLGTSVGLAILVSSVALSVYQVMIRNNSSLPEPLRIISGTVPAMLLLATLAHLVGLLNVSETRIVLPVQLNVLLPLMVSLNFGLIWSQSHTYRHAIITLGTLWYAIAYQLYQWELTGNAQLIAASSIGLIGIIIANLFTTSRQKVLELSDASATLLTFSGVAGLLLSANRLAGGGVTSELIGVIGMQTILCGVGSMLASRHAFKHSLKVLSFFQVLTTVVLIAAISTLTIPQRFEIGTTLFGLLMVGYGLYGWSREEQEDQSGVSLLLNLGSLLSVAPLTIGLLVERTTGFGSQSILHMMHNFGLLIILLGLIGGGLLCKIRSMTLCGFTGLACYMGSLVMLIHLPDQLKSVSVLMMIGGGLFFGTAVLLSIYRDRLLSLPDRIKQGEGIYQVLKWR